MSPSAGEEQTIQAGHRLPGLLLSNWPRPANDTLSDSGLLLVFVRQQRVAMRPEALRRGQRAKRPKPSGPRRCGATRWAKKATRTRQGAWPWSPPYGRQEPHRRTARQVIDNLRVGSAPNDPKKARKKRAPRPTTRSAQRHRDRHPDAGNCEMFDEFDRRDRSDSPRRHPGRRRRAPADRRVRPSPHPSSGD